MAQFTQMSGVLLFHAIVLIVFPIISNQNNGCGHNNILIFDMGSPKNDYSKIINTGFKIWSDLHYLYEMSVIMPVPYEEILEINLGRLVTMQHALAQLVETAQKSIVVQYDLGDFEYVFNNIVHYSTLLDQHNSQLIVSFHKIEQEIRGLIKCNIYFDE